MKINTTKIPYPVVQIARYVLGWRVRSRKLFVPFVEQKCGLEVGGPSGPFLDTGILPLYRHVLHLDNCVYSKNTPWKWQGSDRATYSYHPRKPEGRNFILESTALNGIADDSYDFILSSHSLEHSANPVKALKEWSRVTKPGGAIILVLPHYKYTFDHRRTPTSLAHMLEDFRCNTTEADTTHFEEVLQLHDLSYDDNNATPEQFRDRCMNNLETRWIHHHVFDENNARELLEAAGLTVLVVEIVKPHHLILLGCN
jgi:SAM-dependent methyltransferase